MTDIYHITHLTNLPTILAEGGLFCDSLRLNRGISCTGIAHQHIKDRRAARQVPLARQGTLADYVPFYFGPRSPMLYAISRGAVASYSGSQEDVLHLVVSAEAVHARGLPYTFTDGHAEIAFSKFYGRLNDLNQVDWAVMRAQYWADTQQDNDRKRRRQAEFLVHNFIPWDLVHQIGVATAAAAASVTQLLVGTSHVPEVRVMRGWYY